MGMRKRERQATSDTTRECLPAARTEVRMKSRAVRFLSVLLITITATVMVSAQLQLGGTNMTVSRASTLNMPISVSRGVALRSFAMRVGGVAFDRTARPAPGTTVNALGIRYDPTAEDGRRLLVTMNGTEVRPSLPDWQLIPIARVVASGQGSLVTLFGDMPTRAEAEAVTARGGRIVNYHPGVQNQLLGLRMLQLDMLIFNPDSVELPTTGTGAQRRYLMGLGEQRPDVARGRAAFDGLRTHLEPGSYRSYIVSDYQRDVTFALASGTLRLDGTPYFYFWRMRSDEPDFEKHGEDLVFNQLNGEYRKDLASGKVESKSAWCRARIEQLQATKDFADLASVPGSSIRRLSAVQLDAMKEERRCSELFEISYGLEATRVVHLKQLSDSFSARTASIEAINPAVWESAVRTMQYGALFRFFRKNNPAAWEQFIASMRGIAPHPAIETPTEVYIPSARVPAAR